jgi:hypothetical protein
LYAVSRKEGGRSLYLLLSGWIYKEVKCGGLGGEREEGGL